MARAFRRWLNAKFGGRLATWCDVICDANRFRVPF